MAMKDLFDTNVEKFERDYPDVYYYMQGLIGAVESVGNHPAGVIASPVTLPDNYGTFWSKDGKRVTVIDMEEVHDVELIKFDVLGLKNVGVIKHACRLANIPYPKAYKIDFNDKNVYNEIAISPIGIFQFENAKTHKSLVDYKPNKLNDLSVVNAAIRPSGDSYRDRLFNHEINKNPSELIDELLADNNGYLIFQEDTIAFLQKICGLSGSEADNVRRAIGRKQLDRLEKALPSILEGYCNKSDKPREIAEEEAKTFIQILIDSASYQFGKNHSTGYSMIGFYCAWLRHYHPLEFVTSLLICNESLEDLNDAESLARIKGINIEMPKYGKAKGEYFCDKETNTIYKGVGSIKGLGNHIGDALYDMSQEVKFDNFLDLMVYIIDNQVVGASAIKTLVLLGYFDEFGENYDILRQLETIIARYKRTLKDSTKVARYNELKETIKNRENVPPMTIQEKIKAESDYCGGVSIKIPDADERLYVVMNISTQYANRNIQLYRLKDGTQHMMKIKAVQISECGIEVGDVIGVLKTETKKGVRKINDEWVETGLMNTHITFVKKY